MKKFLAAALFVSVSATATSLIFSDGFESGDTSAWSSTVVALFEDHFEYTVRVREQPSCPVLP